MKNKKIIAGTIFMIACITAACSQKGNKNESVEETTKYVEKEYKVVTQGYHIPDELRTSEGLEPNWTQEDPQVALQNYPDSKKPVAPDPNDPTELVTVYYIENGWVNQIFELEYEITPETIIDAMSKGGAIKKGTSILEYTQDQAKGKLVLDKVESVYNNAKEEMIVACIVNTFCDNLGLDSLDLTIGDKNYGSLEFTYDYDEYPQ